MKETGDIIEAPVRMSQHSQGSGFSGTAPVAEIRYFAPFACERVPMTKEDVLEIKRSSNADPGGASLILLGFKPVGSIPAAHTLENSYLVYPNDEKVVGSTVAFANLHAAMLRKKVLAIGELLTRGFRNVETSRDSRAGGSLAGRQQRRR